MPFKFEGLRVWDRSLAFADLAYRASSQLPREEEFNLKSQMRRAATSVALNIAEGSIGQSNAEQARFLGMAIRSLVEVIACVKLAERHGYNAPADSLKSLYHSGEELVAQLHALRSRIAPSSPQTQEPESDWA